LDGAKGAVAGAKVQHAADRTDDTGGGGDESEQAGRFGLGEQGLQLGGTAGGLMAEDADQPATAAGEWVGEWVGLAGAAVAGPAWFGQAAGGEAGHQALEAASRAIDAAPERHHQGDEARFADEAAGEMAASMRKMMPRRRANSGA
jgi:hypothetical protein